MNLQPLRRGLLLAIAVLTSSFLTACGTDKAAFNKAQADKARAGQVEVALAVADRSVQEARQWPEYPSVCRRHQHSGILLKDTLPVANQKADNAIGEGNRQTDYCAAWYDRTRKARTKIN